MMGFGSHGYGGSYLSPSSSSLSASAPPFTIYRSASKTDMPVDLTEPAYAAPLNSSLHNWLPPRSPTSEPNFVSNPNLEFSSVPSSNPYPYRSFQAVEVSNNFVPHSNIASPGSANEFTYGRCPERVVEPNSCYPSYLSSAVQNDSPLVSPDQTGYPVVNPDWSPAPYGPAFNGSSNKDLTQRSPGLNHVAQWVGSWNGLAEWEKGKQGEFDGTFFSKETDAPISSMFKNFAKQAHPLKGLNISEEASHNINMLDLEKFCGSRSTEKSKGKNLNLAPGDYYASMLGSRPRLPEIESPFFEFGSNTVYEHPQTAYSAPNEKPLGHHTSLSDCASVFKPSPPLVIRPPAVGTSSKVVFDPSQLRVHLERNDLISSESSSTKNGEMLNKDTITNDAANYMWKMKSGHDGFNLDLNNSIEETVDHYNPAVDSPCWKGVPVTRSSPFDASERPEMRKLEVGNNSNNQMNQIFSLNTGDKVSSQKPDENTISPKMGCSESGLEFPWNPVINMIFGEQKSDDPAKVSNYTETDETNKHGRNADITQQSLGSKTTSEAELPVDNASAKLTTVHEGQSTPTIDVMTLVSTIRSLSDLLLFHCTSGSCQLQQKDLEAVQSVINVLTMSVSKNAEKMALKEELTSSRKSTSDFRGELDELNKGFTLDRSQLNAGENDGRLDTFLERDDLVMVLEDQMTQALKEVLSENFHDEEDTEPQTLLYKNLWLEAEAALCSVNYKARFNRMKLEMEKCKLPKSRDASESKTDEKKLSESVVSPDQNEAEDCLSSNVQNSSILNPSSQVDDVMARFHILSCRVDSENSMNAATVDNPSSFKVSLDPIKLDQQAPKTHEANSGPMADIPGQDSTKSYTNNQNNDEASVLARFHILKSRVDNSSPVSLRGQQSPQLINLAHAGQQAEDECSDTKMEFYLQFPSDSASSTEGQLLGDDLNPPNMPVEQRSVYGGWYNGMSADWEHVMKDEVEHQNR
ncbi:hypothetical protein UlMin_024628 [Ulmus minor]